MFVTHRIINYDKIISGKAARDYDGDVVPASAYGQYVAGLIGAGMAEAKENAGPAESLMTYTEGYKMLGIYALIAGVVLILISPLVKN